MNRAYLSLRAHDVATLSDAELFDRLASPSSTFRAWNWIGLVYAGTPITDVREINGSPYNSRARDGKL